VHSALAQIPHDYAGWFISNRCNVFRGINIDIFPQIAEKASLLDRIT
jgi:hypothetical protein